MTIKRVYLAGSMRGDWRETVRKTVTGDVEFLIPTGYGSIVNRARDKMLIQQADIIFMYWDGEGRHRGVSWELGYAEALHKPMIGIVLETPDMSLYTEVLIMGGLDFRCGNLYDGIQALQEVINENTGG